MGSPPSFKTSAVMLSFPGALFRFSRLMAALTSVGRMEEYLGYLFEFARRAVLEVVWYYRVGIELLTPLYHPVPVMDVLLSLK